MYRMTWTIQRSLELPPIAATSGILSILFILSKNQGRQKFEDTIHGVRRGPPGPLVSTRIRSISNRVDHRLH
jgi:hypothetical protein